MEASPHRFEAGAPEHEGVAREQLAIALIAAAVFLVHLLNLGGYGYFRDEFYYIACARHLAFGYVDHPPLSILILYLTAGTFGYSLFAIRVVAALAAPALVLLTARMTRAMGGQGFAPILAALAVSVCPVLLGMMSFYSMNAFEPLFWTAAAYVVARIVDSGEGRLWLLFGAIAGLGLENKHSMLFFCFGIVVGLALTENRRWLWSKWLWMGGALALALFLPNLIWEARYGWPTLEFMRNSQIHKNYHASLPEFIVAQIVQVDPFLAPLWLAGLCWLFFSERGCRYRLFGWAYAAIFVVFVIEGAKPYYFASIYPTLLIAGAIWLCDVSAARNLAWLRAAYAAIVVIDGIAAAPLVIPVLPPSALAGYARSVGLTSERGEKVIGGERHRPGSLPQLFADRLGWEQMVAAVARAYRGLSPEEREHCAIFASNYGEAGAIDMLGPKYGLPHAYSSHNNYWLWGPPATQPQIALVLHARRKELEQAFSEVTQVATFSCQYCMPYENDLPIYICRGPKQPLSKLWPLAKVYD